MNEKLNKEKLWNENTEAVGRINCGFFFQTCLHYSMNKYFSGFNIIVIFSTTNLVFFIFILLLLCFLSWNLKCFMNEIVNKLRKTRSFLMATVFRVEWKVIQCLKAAKYKKKYV